MLADQMRRLAEEIAGAYEERVQGVAMLKVNTAELLGEFNKGREEMADRLRSDLDRFKSDLDAAEADRKDTTQAELKEMADRLRSDLDRFKSDLDAAEADRKTADQAEISERKWAISSILGDFKKDREEAGIALREFVVNKQSVRQAIITGPAKAEAAVEVKPVEEAIDKEEVEEEIPEKEEEKEELTDQILHLLDDYPDGLKMVEIADIMGIENWRSLIPVIRSLLDQGELRKDGSTYYVT